MSRRRFLATASALFVLPAAAFAQEPLPERTPSLNPFEDLLRDLFGGPRHWQRREPFPQPEPELRRESEVEIVPEEWFLEPVSDGPFRYRRVNLRKIEPEFHRQLVRYPHSEPAGTIVVDPRRHFLYSLREGGMAIRYGVGVGRQGFDWRGEATVGRKQEWPDWYPPKEMRQRQPELPEMMPGGPANPLGARALYLFEGNRDTLYRIHGTAEPWSIGRSVSSGCIRMLNEEAVDLYLRTPVGTRVIVL